MFELLTFIIVVLVIVGAVLENIRLKNKNVELLFALSQSLLDSEGIKRSIFNNKTQDESEVEKDHLITFLSDTREIAFDEIEKIQNAIKEFIDIADTHFGYFDKYGLLTEGYPHYESMKILSEEYKKLKKFIPEQEDNGR